MTTPGATASPARLTPCRDWLHQGAYHGHQRRGDEKLILRFCCPGAQRRDRGSNAGKLTSLVARLGTARSWRPRKAPVVTVLPEGGDRAHAVKIAATSTPQDSAQPRRTESSAQRRRHRVAAPRTVGSSGPAAALAPEPCRGNPPPIGSMPARSTAIPPVFTAGSGRIRPGGDQAPARRSVPGHDPESRSALRPRSRNSGRPGRIRCRRR